jgi:hypothetical protein
VQIGGESFAPEHRFLNEDEAVEVIAQFRRAHPYRARLICTILGWGNLRDEDAVREFVRARPFVALRPLAPVRELVPSA